MYAIYKPILLITVAAHLAASSSYLAHEDCVKKDDLKATAALIDPHYVIAGNGTFKMQISSVINLRGVGLVQVVLDGSELRIRPAHGFCIDYKLDTLKITTKTCEEHCSDQCVDSCKNFAVPIGLDFHVICFVVFLGTLVYFIE